MEEPKLGLLEISPKIKQSRPKFTENIEYTKPDNCLPLYNKSYETLEFLGDSILGSVIT